MEIEQNTEEQDELLQYVKNALDNIQDPQLRHALKNFLIRCHQEKV